MRKRLWIGALVVLISAVAVSVLTTGCESFKPKPPPDPDPPATAPEDTDFPDATGKWDIELRTNGTEFLLLPKSLTMTLVQTGDEVKGHWTLGVVDGDVDEDGNVELLLRVTVEPLFFDFEGEIDEDEDEMSGEWKSNFPPPRDEGTWKAEKD
ncbi:MAG: hypothetical protein HQ559_14135 [Lentisphaerae bacterium]|nr:hypothetical protein [Lentisphaerota bacterium]